MSSQKILIWFFYNSELWIPWQPKDLFFLIIFPNWLLDSQFLLKKRSLNDPLQDSFKTWPSGPHMAILTTLKTFLLPKESDGFSNNFVVDPLPDSFKPC